MGQDTRDVVLIILDAYGGSLAGRTKLQKLSYFAGIMAGLDLGFQAHYYGPYSPIIEQAVGELKSLGFVSEETLGFGMVQNPFFGEVRRFDYQLTADGKTIVADLQRRIPQESERLFEIVSRIKGAGDPDYQGLSLAAKTYFILNRQGKPVTYSDLENEAKNFSWDLPSESVRTAVDFLAKLGLVEKK
ncbi:MAG: hypothetical protein ACREQI_10175 [Candidatus Binataceae bacterium]